MNQGRGTLYLVAGVLLVASSAGTMVLARFILRDELGVASIALFLVGGAGLWASFALFRRGLRSLQRDAKDALREDDRAPILYLRSFIDDDARQDITRVKIGVQQFVPDPRAEDALAPLLNCLGPFVAIGRPGEPLPETGANRLYVNDGEWKEQVAELMARARLVVILGRATTEGVHWEIRQAVAALRPEQLVFFFPSHGASRESQYQAFKQSVRQFFPRELPDELGNASFLRFASSWVPEPVTAQSTNPLRSTHESLLRMIQAVEPGFVEPPFWRTVPKPRLYAFGAIVGLLVALVLSLVGYAIRQIGAS